MKFKGIEKKLAGRFITRYDVRYEMENGQEKVYEMIARDPAIKTEEDLVDSPVEAVALIMHSEDGEKILLNREFRMATGRAVYNFPAGLIDPGETPEESAARELWEETGLKLVHIDDVLGTGYGAIGFSNEKSVCVIGTAAGSFQKSTSPEEEIRPGWFTKKQILEMIHTEPFSARTQAYCYAWAKVADNGGRGRK